MVPAKVYRIEWTAARRENKQDNINGAVDTTTINL
jgi:hypothetical protein